MNPLMGTALIAGNAIIMPCACGTDIVAINDHDGRVIAVKSHQRMPEHRAWLPGRAGTSTTRITRCCRSERPPHPASQRRHQRHEIRDGGKA